MKYILKHAFNLILLSCTSFSVLANVVLVDGYVRAMPASVPNSAAYFELANQGGAVKLIAVTTDAADEAQLHTMVKENGVIKMREKKSFLIQDHGTLKLTPTSDHVMLLGLKKTLVAGQTVKLTLKFDNGQQQVIHLTVRQHKMAAGGGKNVHH